LFDVTTGVRAWVVALGIFAATPAWAITLTEAVARARQSDPAYLTAQANLSGARAREKQALGAMGPQISVAVNTNDNRRRYDTLDSERPPANDGYNSKGAQLNLTMPLVRRASSIALDQSALVVNQYDHQRAAAEQDLLVRLAQAWFDAMYARDQWAGAASQVAATAYQWEQASHALKVGLTGLPAAEEARYKYDQALAEQLGFEAELGAKQAALEQIVGPLPSWMPPALADEAQLGALPAARLDDWLAQVESNSPQVAAAQRGLDAANEEIRKQRAGHDPTLDLVANYGKNGQRAGSFPGQDGFRIKQNAVGLQLNIPLFSGGTQNAKVREAVAMRDRAQSELDQARRAVRATAKQAWYGWQAGVAQQAAARQGLKFTSIALSAVQAGQGSELKSELDVLQARQQRDAVLRDGQRARYQMITSQLKLKASAGLLVDADLTQFDRWLSAAELPLAAAAQADTASAQATNR
jgi:outer membrane protein